MKDVGIAMLLMVVATVCVHLGLPQAMAQVVVKICKCHKCLSFWLTLFGLLAAGYPCLYAALLSVLAAYTSNWFAVLLIFLQKIYTQLWERLNKIPRNREN